MRLGVASSLSIAAIDCAAECGRLIQEQKRQCMTQQSDSCNSTLNYIMPDGRNKSVTLWRPNGTSRTNDEFTLATKLAEIFH
jgi:hypothetical protein